MPLGMGRKVVRRWRSREGYVESDYFASESACDLGGRRIAIDCLSFVT